MIGSRGQRDRRVASRRAVVSVVAVAMMGSAASAATATKPAAPSPSIWEQDKLTGDWGGERTALGNKGVDITLNYIAEAFGVLSGGLAGRGSYEGQLEFSVDADLRKLIGWTGASAHVTIFQIHDSGSNVVENTGSLADSSNIDALPATRLYTAWYQQNFGDLLSLRIGQLAADGDFANSPTAGGLLNGTFGWPGMLSADLPSGGPAYPLATPGMRVQLNATKDFTVIAGVYSGDPAGAGCTIDPQLCNRHGTTFSFSGGALWLGELRYRVNQGNNTGGLPGVYELGAWRHTGAFPDQRFGFARHGDWGIYGVADQTVWQAGARRVSLFLRGGYAPPDRNLVSYYVDGGAGLKGLLPSRDDDVFSFGVAYAKISNDAIAADRAAANAVRSAEVVFELSYAAQLAKWWVMQPDIQYIVRPNGGQNPNDPRLPLGHAFVAGVRSTIMF